MPSTVKVRVKGARNLPPMDSRRPNLAAAASSVLSPSFHPGPPSLDAYVHVSLGGHSSNLIASTEEEELNSHHHHSYNHSNSSNNNDHGHNHPHHSGTTGGTPSSSSHTQKGYTARTKVCRRSLNPTWDEEFRFDVGQDSILQDEPLIFRVCDWDAISTDESIGLVTLI